MEAPIHLSQQAIEDFKAIYHDEFGVDLSDGEAQETALCLLRFFRILAQPFPGNDAPETASPQSRH